MQCTINEIANGVCTPYSVPVSTQPTLLCNSGVPTIPIVSNGSWTYDCQGVGNNTQTVGCVIPCLNGDCGDTIPCDPAGTGANACTDGIQPNLNIGDTCNDLDGCICGNNVILNGTVCQSFIPQFDGKKADLTFTTHRPHTGSIARGDMLSFTIVYKNNGPDTATGTVVQYHFSELLSGLVSDTLFTVS